MTTSWRHHQVMTTTTQHEPAIEAVGLTKRYGDVAALDGLDLVAPSGKVTALLGPNGAGKTTFLRVLLGELTPDAGEVVTGKRTRVAYYDQQRARLDPEATVYEAAGGGPPGAPGEDFVELSGRKVALRDYLDDLLFPVSMQRMQVRALSGGERNRLLLATLFLQGANVLVLDEPTNDLDLVTLNVLERLLLEFGGSLLLVTHDRYFLDKVATAILAFEGGGRAVRYEGNYEMYRRLKEQAEAASAPRAPPRPPPGGSAAALPAPPGGPATEGPPSRSRRLSFNEQRELEGIEAVLLEAEERKAALEARLADPVTYQKEGAAVPALRRQLEDVTAEVERLYVRWQELESRAS